MKLSRPLLRDGKPSAATAQFVIAQGLDLAAPDRAALGVFLARTATAAQPGGSPSR